MQFIEAETTDGVKITINVSEIVYIMDTGNNETYVYMCLRQNPGRIAVREPFENLSHMLHAINCDPVEEAKRVAEVEPLKRKIGQLMAESGEVFR